MAPLRPLFLSLSVALIVLASEQSAISKEQDTTIADPHKVPLNFSAARTSLIASDDINETQTRLVQKDSIEVSSEEDKSEEDLDENEANDKEDNNEDGAAEDEYEDELKAVAESHEAMSHDDTKKSNTSFYDSKTSDEKLITTKNFDSREKSFEDTSDENESSNEADIDEDIQKEKNNKEVIELLEKKRKRLPTVKKELGTQKEILSANDTLDEKLLTENVLKILVKLAEDPQRWERVHQLLMDVEGGLEFSRRALQARKRNLLPTSFFNPSSTTPTVDDPLRTFKKPKKKKKKKKPHHRSTTTSLPLTSPFVTTTESPWLTTPVQWRFVAEKLFGTPWRENLKEENPKNLAKVRYSVISKPRTPLPGQQLIDEKQRENLKTLNGQREALMLKSAREYSQPRLLHFGKVNTHQVSLGHREVPSVFGDDPMRIRDYDPPELVHYQHSRFPQYGPLRDFSLERYQDDFQNDFGLQSGGFARNQEYRPSGREFAASKSWQDSQFDYERPWKLDDMTLPITASKWSWRQNARDLKPWLPWRKSWKGDYWSRLESEDDEEDSLEKSWQMHQRHHQQPWKLGSSSWPGDKSLQVPPWAEKSTQNRHQDQSLSWDKAKNRSELKLNPSKQDAKEKNVLPKITMKSWNSLTSDPATWPFKLPAAKPWPKDQNGKSYNPNADLVRKLGLDKQNRLLSEKNPSKDFKPLESQYKERSKSKDSKVKGEGKDSVWPVKVSGIDDWMSKARSSENLSADDDSRSWTGNLDSGGKTWPGAGKNVSPKIQSVGGWVMPAEQSRPYDLKHMVSYDKDSGSRSWSGRTDERMWNSKSEAGPWPQKISEDWNESFGKQSGGSSNWPSKWKQFAYHRVTAMPITKSGTTLEGSAKPKNAFIAVSAVSSPKYNGNEWRKNDIEETPIGQNSFRSVDPDHPASQLRSDIESPIYAWKKDGKSSNKTRSFEILPSDPLEHQLEDLRMNSSQNDTKNKNEVNGSEFLTSLSLNPANGSFVGNLTKERDKQLTSHESKGMLEK